MSPVICVTSRVIRLYCVALGRPYRLAVRTPPFHGGSRGSIPLRVANFDFPLGSRLQFPALPKKQERREPMRFTPSPFVRLSASYFLYPQDLRAKGDFIFAKERSLASSTDSWFG